MTKHLVWLTVLITTIYIGHLNGQRMERYYRAEISHKEDVIKGMRQDKAVLYVYLTAALFQVNGGPMSPVELNKASETYTINHQEWADIAFHTNLAMTETEEDVRDNEHRTRMLQLAH